MFEEKKTDFSEIPEIVKKLAKIKGVKAIYLFGSYATGGVHNKSDIDICVIYDLKIKGVEDKNLILIMEISMLALFGDCLYQYSLGFLKKARY